MVAKKQPLVPPGIAVEYAAEVRRRLGSHAQRNVLFGSHARGEATPASDYDFIVVVDARGPALREQLLEAGVSLLDRREALCAPLLYDAGQWERVRVSPLGWNVEREGVAL